MKYKINIELKYLPRFLFSGFAEEATSVSLGSLDFLTFFDLQVFLN